MISVVLESAAAVVVAGVAAAAYVVAKPKPKRVTADAHGRLIGPDGLPIGPAPQSHVGPEDAA